jgi:hypothetical protein
MYNKQGRPEIEGDNYKDIRIKIINDCLNSLFKVNNLKFNLKQFIKKASDTEVGIFIIEKVTDYTVTGLSTASFRKYDSNMSKNQFIRDYRFGQHFGNKAILEKLLKDGFELKEIGDWL